MEWRSFASKVPMQPRNRGSSVESKLLLFFQVTNRGLRFHAPREGRGERSMSASPKKASRIQRDHSYQKAFSNGGSGPCFPA